MATNGISKFWIILGKIGTAIVIACVLMYVLTHSFSRIEETELGVLEKDGKIKTEVLKPGIVFHAPFVSEVHTIPVTPQQLSLKFTETENGFITKEMETVGAQIQITWKYEESRIIDIVKQYNRKTTEGIIWNATHTSFIESIYDYSMEQLLQNKEDVGQVVLNVLKSKMSKYPVEILQMTIIDWELSDSYKRYLQENNIKYP